MGKNYGYNKWTEQEEDFVLENAKAFDGTFTHEEILRGLKQLTGVERNKKSIQHKISRLLAKYGLHNPQKINFESYPLHKDLTLLDTKLDKGSYGRYRVMCTEGHITYKEPCNWRAGCSVCAGDFVGGIPQEDYRPAVVYLIYVEKLNALKIGYATGIGEDAVVSRFEKWTIPYKYTIVAYDQSTRTEAAEHEQWLLDKTLECKTFYTSPGFDGWTEFRDKKVLNQILPEYETVLDTAFKI